MRVLQLVHAFELGGTERQLLLLDRLLRDVPGLVVELAALRLRGPLARELADREPPPFEFPVRSTYGVSFWRQAAKLRRRLRDDRIDLVHSHDVYSNWLNVVATRGTRTRSLVSQRNLRQPGPPALRLLQRLEVKSADHVLVNSLAIAQRLLARGADARRITVVANAVEMRDLASRSPARAALRAELGLDGSAPVVGVVANFRPVKGHDLLIDAVDICRERCRHARLPVHFVLVGDGEERARIERRVSDRGLSSIVRFLGARPDGPELASAFDLSVLCSREEGLPNALLEAMAAGTPVVSTAVGGARDLVEDGVTGFLVSERAPSALADRMLEALDPRGPARAIALRAYDSVAGSYSTERLRDEIVACYRTLASSARGGNGPDAPQRARARPPREDVRGRTPTSDR